MSQRPRVDNIQNVHKHQNTYNNWLIETEIMLNYRN